MPGTKQELCRLEKKSREEKKGRTGGGREGKQGGRKEEGSRERRKMLGNHDLTTIFCNALVPTGNAVLSSNRKRPQNTILRANTTFRHTATPTLSLTTST